MDNRLYITYGADAKEMALRLLRAADVELPTGARIAIKPNLVVPQPASEGATTHPGVCEAVIEYALERGCRDICIIESSAVGYDTMRAYSACGYEAIQRKYGVPLIDLKTDKTVRVETDAGPMQICEQAYRADYLVNLPVVKAHCQTAMTCALKNLKGCIPDSEKRRFHSLGIHKPVAALAAVLPCKLIVADGICGDLSFEEGGTPVATNRMLLGHDMVQLDAYCTGLIGLTPQDVAYIGFAERYGAGSAHIAQGDIVQLGTPADAGTALASSSIVKSLTKSVAERAACSVCYGNLVHALHHMDGACSAPIAIGQGYQGVPFDGIGIGKCCDGARTQVKGCPPSAQVILAALRNASGH